MKAAACFCILVLASCAHRQSLEKAKAPTDVTIITAEDIERAPGLSLEQLLVTRVPGISLSRAADGHTVIHIRGTSSILGEQEPLFVVNGIPLSSGANLSAINPRDIESLQVLRDASSTVMYGIRGANGVILIKTKQ